MKILVLLCVYNGRAYLEAQVKSIMEQTVPGVRLLLSDDGSGDGSRELIEQLAERYPGRIDCRFRERGQGGAARHFLEALQSAEEADYVFLADQDDWWQADKIEKSLALLQEAEKRRGRERPLLMHCDMAVIDEKGREIAPSFWDYQGISPERNSLPSLLVQNNVTGAAMAMNHSLLQLLGGRGLPERAVMHDHWIALVAAAFGEILFTRQTLYAYRQHGCNVLGAEKGGFFFELQKRLGLGKAGGLREMNEKSRQSYRALFAQAEDFYRLYGTELPEEKRGQVEGFLALQAMGRLQKIFHILKGGYCFNRWHRTLGECLFL